MSESLCCFTVKLAGCGLSCCNDLKGWDLFRCDSKVQAYLIESRMPRFVIVEEDLRIKMSYPFNEVNAVFLLNNPHYHQTKACDV